MKLKTALLFFAMFIIAFAANGQRKITGKVTDAKTGEPLPFVTVVVKGTTVGVHSDIDGNYTITVPPNAKILEFSFVGYKVQEFSIETGISVLNVALQEDYQMLEEVMVVGYGTLRKANITGSVTTIKASQITKNDKKKGSTWKRSGMPENSIRLEVGDGADDFLPVQAAQMAVQVDGFRVRVLMDCFFFNNKKDGLEGNFKLRLPSGATPYYFAFGTTEYLDEKDFDDDEYDELIQNEGKTIRPYGKQIPYTKYDIEQFGLSPEEIDEMVTREWDDVKEARIVSKQKAARAYEQTVSNKIDPALMEWAGADMFSCRVFPLFRGKLHRVVIGYDLNMTEALDFREYTLTLPNDVSDFKLDVAVYTSKNMTPEITPPVETTQNGNHVYFSLTNPKKKEYTIQYNIVEPLMLIDEDHEGFAEGYFAANYRINLPEVKQENLPSDAVFVFDVSLSSQPDKFNVWLKLMEEILTNNKDVIKNFSVLFFNIETRWWNRYYSRNNYYNLSAFLEYANTLALEGATDLGSALAEASRPLWLKKNAPKHIFLMSDADFNWGESNMHTLKALINDGDRVHTYKTGLSGTNSAVLDYLSKSSGGFSFTVTGEEEAELTAKSFRYRPWIIEKLEFEGSEDFLISGQPSQLYNGQKLIFTGRGNPKGFVYIKVNNGLETKELQLKATELINSNLAKRVYGQIALSQLESYGINTEEATESYATYFRIPNATMSFLMLESKSDYDRFGIDDDDAENFVEKHTVVAIINELLKINLIPLGEGKVDFMAWLKRLEDDSELNFNADKGFTKFINGLPDEIFKVKLTSNSYRMQLSEQQTDKEIEMLGEQNIRYDDMLPLANSRKSRFGKADALKLLSSVIERNPGDFIALRDIAIKAIEWDLGDQAYYMMRRIIANRQYEAVAYLTAAEALAKSGNIEMAIIYYYICLNSNWDDKYGSFKQISALQCARFLEKTSKELTKRKTKIKLGLETIDYILYLAKQINSYLEDEELLIQQADVVIVINWNTNNTDVDLHIHEPNNGHCYYKNRKTEIGGRLTIDVTEGYGPEMYVLQNAVDGKYQISLNYFSDDETKTSSKSKVYVDFYRNWGRANEKHTRKTIILEKDRDEEDVLQFEVKKKIK